MPISLLHILSFALLSLVWPIFAELLVRICAVGVRDAGSAVADAACRVLIDKTAGCGLGKRGGLEAQNGYRPQKIMRAALAEVPPPRLRIAPAG